MTVDAAAASESTPTGVRVRVVDDDVVICRQMAANLSSAGYQVTAHDGARALAQAGGVTISIDCKADLMARFDPALVERVLHNLVGNAARYCNQGGTIAVSARRWSPHGAGTTTAASRSP
jgi:signal transduction histidine kinase